MSGRLARSGTSVQSPPVRSPIVFRPPISGSSEHRALLPIAKEWNTAAVSQGRTLDTGWPDRFSPSDRNTTTLFSDWLVASAPHTASIPALKSVVGLVVVVSVYTENPTGSVS